VKRRPSPEGTGANDRDPERRTPLYAHGSRKNDRRHQEIATGQHCVLRTVLEIER
jgi:hypothetical protein